MKAFLIQRIYDDGTTAPRILRAFTKLEDAKSYFINETKNLDFKLVPEIHLKIVGNEHELLASQSNTDYECLKLFSIELEDHYCAAIYVGPV